MLLAVKTCGGEKWVEECLLSGEAAAGADGEEGGEKGAHCVEGVISIIYV